MVMSHKSKIISVLFQQGAGQPVFAAYSFLLPRGKMERELRNKGWGLLHFEQVYRTEIRDVEVWVREEFKEGKKWIQRCFRTPFGELEEKIVVDPVYGSQWVKEFPIKSLQDYGKMAFIIENTFYFPCYESFERVEKEVGEDGVVLSNVERSPFQKTLLELAGPERLFVDLFENPTIVENLFTVLVEKQRELYRIVASGPGLFVHIWDNVTEDYTSPFFFGKYCLPFYREIGFLLQEHGKLFVVHMDGKLKNLRELIAETPVNVVESFSLPEAGGNLSIEDAQSSWSDKAIIVNFPAFLCLEGKIFIRDYLEKLLSRIDGKRVMVCVSEDLPRDSLVETLLFVSSLFQTQILS
ncbi:MAG: hypothetical protein ACUVQZ_02660 [Candidatus Caldatribacteriaceae bacterium]